MTKNGVVRFNKLGGYWSAFYRRAEIGRSATEELAEQMYDRAYWRFNHDRHWPNQSLRKPFDMLYYLSLTAELVRSEPGGEFIEHLFRNQP